MKTFIAVIATAILFFIFVAAMIAWGADTTTDIETIQTQVAKDFERQYNDARKYGNAIDVCVRAGLVAEGYLQAGDSVSYAEWKRTERTDCRAAGL